MKKKFIIPFVACLVIVLGIIGFITWNNKAVSTITIDINPSIEINLNRKGKVKSVIALNEDAKDVIDNKLKGKTLSELLHDITEKLIDNGYMEDEHTVILLHSTGNIKVEQVEEEINKLFNERNIDVGVIVIKDITKEDKKLAKKYNISLTKASYIRSILKDNKSINAKDLVNKSVNDLDETKNTGNYCPDGYILEGSWCLKEEKRTSATKSEVCPVGYYEYNEKCYEEVPIEHTDNLYCDEGFKLVNNKCVRSISINAEPVKYNCPYGEETTNYKAGITDKDAENANDIVCIDTSNAKHPVSPCETHDGTEYTLFGGKCYWHRAPVIESGCPGKILINGMCWDDASNVLICEGYRDGKRYNSRSEYCEHSINFIDLIITEYKCPKDYVLNVNKCLKDETEDAQHEQICPSGYTLVDNDRCINNNKTKNKENGFVCNGEKEKLKGNICISYTMIEAKHN